MNKSWFYLTLWHDGPPAYTTTVTADIGTDSDAETDVRTAAAAGADIRTDSTAAASIRDAEDAAAEILTSTEVTWLVSRQKH